MGVHQPRAVTIANLLVGGYGLCHERVEDGCKSTCVKFGGKPEITGMHPKLEMISREKEFIG